MKMDNEIMELIENLMAIEDHPVQEQDNKYGLI